MRPRARVHEIIVQEVESELLVYDLRTHMAMALNETSAQIWLLCDGTRDLRTIADAVAKRIGSAVSVELVELALAQLSEKHLLDRNWESNIPTDGASRREVIRRVALATTVALPSIASVIAPTAASAQSVSCTACVKFNQGQVCGLCANVIGTCYDNTGCGAGQATPNVTCAACAAGVGACAGGPGTCSWRV